jgi:hypothetical protein
VTQEEIIIVVQGQWHAHISFIVEAARGTQFRRTGRRRYDKYEERYFNADGSACQQDPSVGQVSSPLPRPGFWH